MQKNVAFLLAPIRENEGLRSSRSYRDITEVDDGSAIRSSSVIRGVSFFGPPKRPLNNIPPGERERVKSAAWCIWTWRRLHECVKRPGQRDQAREANHSSAIVSSSDSSNRT